MPNRRWRRLFLVPFIVLGLLVLKLVSGRYLSTAPDPEPVAQQPTTHPAGSSLRHSLPSLPTIKPTEVDPNTPIVDGLELDKSEVCRGEQNFINVKVHTSNGTDAFLETRFRHPEDGKIVFGGKRIPYVLHGPTNRSVTLYIEGKISVKSASIPTVTVKDCVEAHEMIVNVHRTIEALDQIGLTAQIVDRPPLPGSTKNGGLFVPVSYKWNFGDGTQLETTSPSIVHSYEGRDQSVRLGSFLVKVTAQDKSGQAVEGSALVSFVNPAFGPLVFNNRVVISVGVREGNSVTAEHETIWLYHGYSKSVSLDKVEVVDEVSANGKSVETFRKSYEPQDFLGLSELPAHKSITTRDLTAFEPSDRGMSRRVEVHGHTSDGKEASGAFSLLFPEEQLSRQN